MCTAASAEQRNGSARGTLKRPPSPSQNLVTALLIWVEGPPKGKHGRSRIQGLYPSGHGGCSPSHSLLSQPAGASVYIPKPQVRLWGRNVLSTVMVGKCKCACCGCLELSQPAGDFCRTPNPCLPLAHTEPPTHYQGEGHPSSGPDFILASLSQCSF